MRVVEAGERIADVYPDNRTRFNGAAKAAAEAAAGPGLVLRARFKVGAADTPARPMTYVVARDALVGIEPTTRPFRSLYAARTRP